MDYVENWHTQLFPLLLVSMHVDLRCRIHTYIRRWLTLNVTVLQFTFSVLGIGICSNCAVFLLNFLHSHKCSFACEWQMSLVRM